MRSSLFRPYLKIVILPEFPIRLVLGKIMSLFWR